MAPLPIEERPCFVYFIQVFGERELQLFKIGSAFNVAARIAEMQIGSPVKLRLIGTVECKNGFLARRLEKRLHETYRKQRRRGEWFRLSDAQRKAVIELFNG